MSGELPRRPEVEDDKVSLPSAVDGFLQPNRSGVIGIDSAAKPSFAPSQEYLEVPRTGLVRALSPDTVSNLSRDDSDQSRRGRRVLPLVLGGRRRLNASRSPAPTKTWRGRWDAFWLRNKGLILMLFAQVFGVLMNVTIRILEIEGNNGNGLHPLQVVTTNLPRRA